jgi:hypothetical protein
MKWRDVMQARSETVLFQGESTPLTERLREPVRRALVDRQTCYSVDIEPRGRVGEIIIAITGSKGRLPLLFRHEELEPGYVFRVVRDAVTRYDL